MLQGKVDEMKKENSVQLMWPKVQKIMRQMHTEVSFSTSIQENLSIVFRLGPNDTCTVPKHILLHCINQPRLYCSHLYT